MQYRPLPLRRPLTRRLRAAVRIARARRIRAAVLALALRVRAHLHGHRAHLTGQTADVLAGAAELCARSGDWAVGFDVVWLQLPVSLTCVRIGGGDGQAEQHQEQRAGVTPQPGVGRGHRGHLVVSVELL